MAYLRKPATSARIAGSSCQNQCRSDSYSSRPKRRAEVQQLSKLGAETIIICDDDNTLSFGQPSFIPKTSRSKTKKGAREKGKQETESTERTKSIGVPDADLSVVEVYEESEDGSVDLEMEVSRFNLMVEKMRKKMGIEDSDDESQKVPISKRTRMREKREEKKEEKKNLQTRTAALNDKSKEDKKTNIEPKPTTKSIPKNAKVEPAKSTGKKRGRKPKSKEPSQSKSKSPVSQNRDKSTGKYSKVKAEDSSDEDEEVVCIREVRKVRLEDMTCLVKNGASKKEIRLCELARSNPSQLIRYLSSK